RPSLGSHRMDGAIMSNHGAAAIEIGTVIAILAGMAIAKQRMPVTQPLSGEQPLLSATESQRLSERQEVNRYFLPNWPQRPTRAVEQRLTGPFDGSNVAGNPRDRNAAA